MAKPARARTRGAAHDDASDTNPPVQDQEQIPDEPPVDRPQHEGEPSETEDEDDDPVTATYSVFLNPALPLNRRLLVLQQPNRTDEAPRPSPSELRIKSSSGMVEVDLPLDHSISYDREKGQKWGKTLQASMAAKNGGSHGLAGGFGFGAVQQRGTGRGKSADVDDMEDLDWNESMRQNKVLTTQTLGGQYPEVDEVNYMVGVFKGKDLHLTPVSSLVHLRTQLHHLDATTQHDRLAKDTTASTTNPSSTGAGGGSGAPSSTAGPRAIHMTIKTTGDGNTSAVTTETMADRLRFVQTEPWRKMRYTDENDEAAWDVYNESLFLRHADTAAEDAQLEDHVPRFSTTWGDAELLEAVSGGKKPNGEPEVELKDEPEQAKKADDRGKKAAPRGRPRGGASASAPRRGGRAKASSSKTIDID